MSDLPSWTWQAVMEQASTFAFYAREFEGADFAYADQLQSRLQGEEPKDYGLDVRKSYDATAIRAKQECEKLQRQLEGYHRFIVKVIEGGKQ